MPDYMRDRPKLLDPAIATGLEEAGLLEILSPETMIDKAATERLAYEMTTHRHELEAQAGATTDKKPAGWPPSSNTPPASRRGGALCPWHT